MEDGPVGFGVSRLVRFEGEGSLRAYCDLTVGELMLVKGLRVVQGKQGLFVSMPRQQGKDGKWYDAVTLLNKEVKQQVGRVVLDAYDRHAQS